ncbi:MAG: 1-acyl-sn-glycerol-3-phosphate acyltransferase [Actinobacteria bacterium]|nr:1-acyl-sn-glycerol-3-phosphate acyltransferase [Actinomycetota bacterium]
MRAAELTWAVGRPTLGAVASLASRLEVYGRERVPPSGGLVVAANHFSWLDPIVLGAASPRVLYYMAKIEAHRMPGLGIFIRAFGCFSVRRGESDREAVRMMRAVVADGEALGLFVEGTRQHSGVPGPVQAGAAMVALQEGAPVCPVAIHGTQSWPGRGPVSIAWGEPMTFDGLPKGGRGYKEASIVVQTEIRRLFDWLVDLHRLGRPQGVPPAAGDRGAHGRARS